MNEIPEQKSVRATVQQGRWLAGALDSLARALHPRTRRAAAADLRHVLAALEDLNRSTEADFLKVGEQLMRFLTTSRQVHEGMCELAELVAGEPADLACKALEQVLAHTRHAASRTAETREMLSAIQQATTEVHRSFANFHETQMSLQVAVTLARIETARMGTHHAGLADLATEIGTCSEGIQERVDHLITASEALYERVGVVLGRIAELDTRALSALPTLTAAITTDLDAFQQRRRETAAISQALRSRIDELIEAIGNVVTSVQFHDITRQQVEHAMEGLSILLPAGGAVTIRVSAGGVPDTIRLQAAQLTGASMTFTDSVREIRRQLEVVESNTRQMAAESEGLAGASGDPRHSFCSQMEQGFAEILGTVSECQELDRGAQATLAELSTLLERLRSAVAEIHVVETQLRRLSLNIAVRAGHLDAAGEPLNVIAAAVHELQEDCNNRSTRADEAMESIHRAIASVSAAVGTEWIDSAEKDAADLRARMRDLRSSSEQGAEIAARVTAQACRLSAEIRSLREGLTIDRRFADTVEDCRARLEQFAGDSAGDAGRQPRAGHLLDARLRYTMEAERAIHGRVAQEAATAMTPAVASAATALGDNVELF